MKITTTLLFFFIIVFPSKLAGQSNECDSLYQIFRDKTKAHEVRVYASYEYVLNLNKCIKDITSEVRSDSLPNKTFNQYLKEKGMEYYFHELVTKRSNIGPPSIFSLSKRIDYFNRASEMNSDELTSIVLDQIFKELTYVETEYLLDPRIEKLIARLPLVINDSIVLAEQYYMINSAYSSKSLHTKNVSMCLKALAIYEKHPDKHRSCAEVMSQLAYYLIEVGNEDLSLEYRLKSIEINKITKDSTALQKNYRHMAYNELKHERYESGLEYTIKAIEIATLIKNEEDRLYNIFCKGILLAKLGRSEEALEIQQKSYNEYIKLVKEGNIYIYLSNELGQTNLNLGNYNEALKWGENSRTRSSNHKAFKESFDVIYQAWLGKRNYQKAFENYQYYISYRDSMFNETTVRETTRLELESKFQKERFSDSLEVVRENLSRDIVYDAEINKQRANRNVVIGIGLSLLILAMLLISRLRYVRKTQKELIEKNRIIEIEKENAKSSERAKQQFLANMSHEIRTPMNAVNGMTDILLRRQPKSEQLKYLNAIKESSKSLLVIIDDILDLAKVEAGEIDFEKTPISLIDLVENVRLIMHFKAEEKGLDLQVKVPNQVPYVLGDSARLRQVLINLVGNAIKFTPKGEVRINLTTESVDKGMLNAQFTVSDTGIGIDEEGLEKVFESFKQEYANTSRKYGGTGLGLTISKKMVEQQDGKIWVDSIKGKGSQFHFIIPFDLAPTETMTKPKVIDVQKLKDDLKGIKILLVEDNPFNTIVAQEKLEDAIGGVQIITAENGKIAIERIGLYDFDIVLMDVQMPEMNGYEATTHIRALNSTKSKLPIIALTANVMKDEVDRCYQAGMNEFIGKPFDVNELILKMHTLLLN